MTRRATAEPVAPIERMSDIEPIVQLDVIPPQQIVDTLIQASTVENGDRRKITLLAQAIAGLDFVLEDSLYEIENSHRGHDAEGVTIQTLPHNTGKDHERISVIQPAAWIFDGPDGYFDPETNQIMRNCIGCWEGTASSLKEHLKRSVWNPCFKAYYVVTLIAVLVSILVGVMWKSASYLIVAVMAILYDICAIAFVLINERKSVPPGADRMQTEVRRTVRNILMQMDQCIEPRIRRSLVDTYKASSCEAVGRFLVSYFYEPGLMALKEALKLKGWMKQGIETMGWAEIEAALTVYRFVRQIEESVCTGISDMRFGPNEPVLMKNFVADCIKKGKAEVHGQMMRLLYKGFLPTNKRAEIIIANHYDISMNHFLGRDLMDALRKELNIWMKNKAADPVRVANTKLALDPLGLNSRSKGTRSRRGGMSSQAPNRPAPSHFEG